MFDEPSAAAVALGVGEGAVVDIGGGTTGVSILKKGRVIFTTDEPTGGFQFDLVIAGGLGISLEEAERRKRNPAAQVQLFSVVRPVMEKIASITMRAIQGYGVKNIYLVGGTCGFPGFADLIRQETGISTYLPDTPLYVTPLGIAMSCANSNKNTTPGKSKTNRDRRPRPK
jgi:ethanolamine utilization protein EutJ